MKTSETLDKILGNAIKVRILRHLAHTHEAGSERALAQIASVSQPAVAKPLKELCGQGIIIKNVAGRSHIYRLNTGNILVKKGILPLFRLEAGILSEFGRRLKKRLGNETESAIIYGSVARGNATSESDWDVLLLCQTSDQVKGINDRLAKIVSDLSAEFSCKPDLKAVECATFRKKYADGDPFALAVYNDFINSTVENPLFGKSLIELLGPMHNEELKSTRKK